MASTKEYLDFVLEQLSGLDEISSRAMMGEYILYTMFGPNVTIATAGHPILPELREKLYQYNMPVHIGRNCWIGAGAVIMPGVTIGDNTVIGAGSVVTKDIPAGVVAVGNPCRFMIEINDHDKEFYFKNRRIELSDE